MKKECYTVTGMSCSACSSRVEKGVSRLEGMKSTAVNLLANTMMVEYDESILSPEAIVNTVKELGYGAIPPSEASPAKSSSGDNRLDKQNAEASHMKRRFFFSLCFLIPLMYVSMHHMLLEWFGLPVAESFKNVMHGNENAVTFIFTQFLLLLPILVLNGKFFRVGLRALIKCAPNMDSLVAVGSGAAVIYGIFVLYRVSWGLGHGDMTLVEHYATDIYFESAGTILTLITLGKWLETRSKAKTGQALLGLMALAPETAHVERNGREEEIPSSEVIPGDIILVRPGDRVPVDGEVLEGVAAVDESVITGESLPAEKTAGSAVTAATTCKTGFLRIRAVKVGEDMAIRKIIRLVEEAGATKAPIARMADKIAGIFVPAVMAISACAFAVWMFLGAGFEFSLSISISVLVISCPCALGLATPVAIMVGTGRGAELGILFKSGEALERAHAIDTVILDKTGTITEGRPVVTDVLCFQGTEEALLRTAAGIEYGSGHPLAEAILSHASSLGLPPEQGENFSLIPGRGVSATLGGTACYAGNAAMMADLGIEAAKVLPMAEKLAEEGKTPLFIARGNALSGLIAVADTIKPTSAKAVADLKEMGLHVVMITGDNKQTAEAIRRQTGVDEAVAQALPEDKESRIASFQKEGRTVAMIGDGINDAPALARADLGIAIGAGTDIAIDSADVVLIKSDLADAVTALQLGRSVIRNIKENLFWAFFYNCIGIPLAAGVFYTMLGWKLDPMFGAAAMSMSSVCVVTNALRLRRFHASKQAAANAEPAASSVSAPAETEKEPEKTVNIHAILHIEGMMCSHCSSRVTKALQKTGANAEVSHEKGTALVDFPPSVNLEELTQAVEKAGYTVTSAEIKK